MTTAGIGRRQALTGAAGVGVGVPLLAACGDDGAGSAADPSTPAGDPTSSGGGGSGGGGGASLTTTEDVPVGGGTIFADEKVVVTQPAEGEFRGFTATCTHQGCLVGKVEDGTIQCPCHGSAFSVEDGSVVNGPATAPLEEVDVTVDGDRISLG